MKKLLIISAVFPPEPVVSANLSFDIASALTDKYKVTVLSPPPTRPLGFKFKASTPKNNFEHVQLNSYTCPQSSVIGRFRESYSFGIECYQYILNNPEIACIYANTWPLMAQLYCIKAAKKRNIPVIIHVQDIYPESLTNKIPVVGKLIYQLLLPIDKYVLKNATSIFVISDKMKNYIATTRNIVSDKITVVHNWQNDKEFIDYQQQAQATENNKAPFTFMYLGNIGPVAGVDVLIDAFAKAAIPNTRLVIAGSGSMKEMLEQKAKKITNSVIEFWDVPQGKVAETQAKADVLCLSVKKGAALSSIPSKLPAYMFSKKTILASVDEESDTANCIKDAKCGYVVNPENIDDLAQCMQTVVKLKKEELTTLGESGFNFANKHMSKINNLTKVTTAIESLI
ncbi:MAG: glycosyltransferase family 4 protein [Bacteroidia bacterium]